MAWLPDRGMMFPAKVEKINLKLVSQSASLAFEDPFAAKKLNRFNFAI
jgi:hypothetical protein